MIDDDGEKGRSSDTHINVGTVRTRNLLQLSLRTWSPPQVLQLPNGPEHRRQPDLTGLFAQTSMWTKTVENITIQRSSNVDLVRIGKVLSLTAGAHKAGENTVASLDVDLLAIIVNRGVCRGNAI